MKMALSKSVWKYGLLTLNVLISLVGVIVVSCGVVALGGAGSSKGAYIITFVGFLILIICFLGCCASLRESYVLSMVYVGVVALTIIMQTVLMIGFASMKDDFMKMTANRVDKLWETEASVPGTMNDIQKQYDCCGKESPQDYLVKNITATLPKSCCIDEDCSIPSNIFEKGCTISALTFFDNYSDSLIMATVGLIALEVLGLASAYFLGKNIHAPAQKPDQRGL